ncbi:NAD-dependent epimerase [Solibaculum mannosilyticum]|uniref:NAD-dependent epimerase n=1 Tax=Solibaculum mannosilyticum TaxID=2780922 RepID=A0A7I8D4G8_9FIRM|nr:NAD-dependent epimerase [Solibaculum mannosilyticum]BCI60113.1 NAD-dependent epimerase [Solibaculum mannosilyticum]
MKVQLPKASDAILVTGGAGFIGFHLSKKLLECGNRVVGFDNCNDYYDPALKEARLAVLKGYPNYQFVKGDLADKQALETVFQQHAPKVVVNLAAQAGVRYSIDHPDCYIQSNLVGFFNVLECCRHYPVDHLVYASSSSVYGANKKVPFSTEDQVDHPVSLYAATKKSNELMAYTYSHLYHIPSTGLRFFTVYGPYGRPDMAYFSFTKAILAGKPIRVFNHGDMYRDFTYIDDIVDGVMRLLCRPPKPDENDAPHKVYNIGNNKPEKLMDFIGTLEKCLGKEAVKQFEPMQPGDVYRTYADVDDLVRDIGFCPSTSIQDGLSRFVEWYRSFYPDQK